MSDLARIDRPSAVPARVEQEFSTEQIDLIKSTIAKGATNLELDLFIATCKRWGLDPFAKQVYLVKRWDSREKREVATTQVSIDGYRLIAERTGLYSGWDGPQWCGPEGRWRDVWIGRDTPSAARFGVARRDWGGEFRYAVVTWDQYAQKTSKGDLMPMWRQYGPHMLGNAAERLALRRAFPAELSNLSVTHEDVIDVVAVRSDSDARRAYSVEVHNAPDGSNYLTCSCPAGRVGKPCKHLSRAAAEIGSGEPESSTSAPPANLREAIKEVNRKPDDPDWLRAAKETAVDSTRETRSPGGIDFDPETGEVIDTEEAATSEEPWDDAQDVTDAEEVEPEPASSASTAPSSAPSDAQIPGGKNKGVWMSELPESALRAIAQSAPSNNEESETLRVAAMDWCEYRSIEFTPRAS